MFDLVKQESFINEVEKVWGVEYWVTNNERYCLKFLRVKKGYSCSLHFHKVKDETFFVDSGTCFLYVERNGEKRTFNMQYADSVRIEPGTIHKFWVPKNAEEDCMILEVSTKHDDNDVVRLEESKEL